MYSRLVVIHERSSYKDSLVRNSHSTTEHLAEGSQLRVQSIHSLFTGISDHTIAADSSYSLIVRRVHSDYLWWISRWYSDTRSEMYSVCWLINSWFRASTTARSHTMTYNVQQHYYLLLQRDDAKIDRAESAVICASLSNREHPRLLCCHKI